MLSEEQESAVQMALSGASFFLTGGAGTGKSLVLNEIIKALPKVTTFVTGHFCAMIKTYYSFDHFLFPEQRRLG